MEDDSDHGGDAPAGGWQRVPAGHEIAALVAGLVPFAITMSSSSSRTVNGAVVASQYRDWVAVGGGAVAAGLGLVALSLLKRTAPAQRVARIALICGLVALGGGQILRGFGVIGAGAEGRSAGPGIATRVPGPPLTPPGPDATGLAPIDRSAEARAVLAVWNAPDAAATIHAAAHPQFRASVELDELKIFHDDFTAVMGPFVEIVGSVGSRRQTKDGKVEELVAGEAMFGKGLAAYEVVLTQDGATLRLLNLKLEAPRALNPAPDPQQARTAARAAAGALLAADYPTFDALSLPRIRGGRTPADTTRLQELVATLGGGVRLEIARDEPCGEIQHCVDYHAVGRRGAATMTLKVSAPLGRWRVNHWSFELDGQKKVTP